MSESAEAIQGHVILVAHVTVAPGKVDEVLPLVKALVDYANSDAEPDVLVYRSSRFEEEFAFFEEYKDAAAAAKHRTVPPFLDLVEAVKAGLITKLDVKHYKEI